MGIFQEKTEERKLLNLKKYLIDEYNNKIAEKVIKSITYKLDNLGVMDVGESLKDRFGIVNRLELYDEEQLKTIVKRSAEIMEIRNR